MQRPAYVVFAASIVTCVSELCFCEEDLSRKLLDSIRNAEQAQRGLATVFRVRATRVGDARNPALTGTDTVVFCIRTSSLKAEENVFIAKSVHSSFVTCSISYADESGLVSVWENPKVGVVLEMKLAKESSNLPIQACFYLRPKNAKRLLKGDKLGELVYRTTTEWSKLESLNLPRVPSKSKWVPKRIEMEHFPTSYHPTDGYSYMEILPVWQHVPNDILSDVETAKEFVIGQEFIPPTSRIEKIYFELESRLERVIAAAELEMQKRP